MKFNSINDAKMFLLEVGESLSKYTDSELENFQPAQEMVEGLFISRRGVESGIRNYKKSSDMKAMWRKNRHKFMSGIKAFHSSTKGKQFHRKLGRFLATRMFDDKTLLSNVSFYERCEDLKSLNSAKTHLFIECEFYHPLVEQIELETIVTDYSIRLFNDIESKILYNQELNEDETDFLLDIVETSALIKSFAEKTGKSEAEIETMWQDIKSGLIKSGKKESDESFYALLVTALKNKLNLT